MHQAAGGHHRYDPEHETAGRPLDGPELVYLARDLVPGEAHVPRLLDDVDPRDRPDQRLDPVVAHRLPLQRVQDLLDVEGAPEGEGAVGEALEGPAHGVRKAS